MRGWRRVGREVSGVRQFAGHWYSGRAARLCAVEGALVALALWVTGRHADNFRALAALIAAAACVPAALYLADLYDPQVMRNDRARGSGTLKALGSAALFAALIGLLGGSGLPKGALIGTFGVASLGVLLARAALVTRTDEDAHSRVLILGAGSRAAEVARLIRTQAFGEYQVAGTLDPKLDLSGPARNSEVMRAVAGVEGPPLLTVQAEPDAAEVALAPSPAVVPTAHLVVAAPSASVEAPVLAALAVLIKLESEGPVFYVQERTGRGGKPYRVQKLRTMHKDAEKVSGPVWATRRDPRVTRLGAFLRKTRLDEIPQVFAVFRGDMSFVGPRPERPFFVQQIKQQIPFFGLREAVKPGITGWAQIRYPYGSTIEDAKSKLEYDLYYVEHRSLFLDLAICFHTAKIVLFGRGAR